MNFGGDKWVIKVYGILILLFLTVSSSTTEDASLMLSPSAVVSVCPGEQLTFVCSTNRSFVQWNVTVFRSGHSISRTQLVASVGASFTSLVVDMVSFHIMRIGSLPLTTTLTITNNITTDLNNTRVNCTDIGSSLAETSSSVAIIKIGYPSPPEIDGVDPEIFGEDNVTVSLEWAHENGVMYHVDVIPQVPIRFLRSSTIILLTVLYNMLYNVTVVGSLCGQNSTQSVIEIYLEKCDYPVLHQVSNSSIAVTGYSNPAFVGANVTFACSPGLVLTGPNTSTCIENRKWEPDPRNIECKADCGPPFLPTNGYLIPYTSTLEGAMITIVCHGLNDGNIDENLINLVSCTRHGIWEPDPSEIVCGTSPRIISVTGPQGVIIAISLATSFAVLFFTLLLLIVIVIIIYCWRKRKQKHVTSDEDTYSQAHPTNVTVIYEEVQPRSQEQDLELEQNVAYGPIRPYSL